MNKNNVLNLGFVGLFMCIIAGCATGESTLKKSLNSEKSGNIVGYAINGTHSFSLNEKQLYCHKFNLSDSRCSNDDFILVTVMSEFGFAKAFTGGFGFAHKSLNLPDNSKSGCGTNASQDQKCTYVKLQVVPNGVGTITEVVSRPGDGKCHWAGLPRAGGVVCPGIFNYKTDNAAAVSQ